MKGQMHTDLGQVIIDEEVIATYAGINALECFGIVGMASVNVKDGFAQLLKCLYCYSYREFNPECKVSC